MRRLIVILIVVVILLFALAGVLNRQSETETESQRLPARPSSGIGRTSRVTYEATGEGRAYVTYKGPNGEFEEEVVALPWRKTIFWRYKPGLSADITVYRRTDSIGVLACRISVNDRLIETNTVSSGELQIAICGM